MVSQTLQNEGSRREKKLKVGKLEKPGRWTAAVLTHGVMDTCLGGGEERSGFRRRLHAVKVRQVGIDRTKP
jgi:hypothetical protein